MNGLIKFIYDKKTEYENESKEYSKKLIDARGVYNILCDKYGNLDKSKIPLIFDEYERYSILCDITDIENSVLSKELDYFMKEADKLIKKIARDRSSQDPIGLMESYNKNKEEIARLKSYCDKLVIHMGEYFFEVYSSLQQIKEEQKAKIKIATSTMKNINTKRELTPQELAYVTGLIDDIEDDNLRSQMSDELNKYLSLIQERKEKSKVVVVSKPKTKPVFDQIYTDSHEDEVVQEEDNIEILNYYNSIKTFTSLKDFELFFDSIRYKKDINKIILSMIELLEKDGNEKVINFLQDYVAKLSNEEEEVLADTNINKPLVLYNGFLSNRKIVQDDIDAIPKENYSTIKTAIDKIKEDGAKSKRTNLVNYRKTLKLRYKDVRVYFRMLARNVYIIIGVFVKKDQKGENILSTVERRNTRLRLVEKDIVKTLQDDKIWPLYKEANDEYENEITNILKSKIKD